MVYELKPGSRIRTAAEVVGRECERLEREGRLTAKDLVEVSRPKDAPLHNEFTWDNNVAGDLWREHQARHIINSVVIRNDRAEPQRVFFNVKVACPEYHSIDTLLSSDDGRKDLLETAMRELQAFQKKYGQLEELCGVFAAIDEVQRKVSA